MIFAKKDTFYYNLKKSISWEKIFLHKLICVAVIFAKFIFAVLFPIRRTK